MKFIADAKKLIKKFNQDKDAMEKVMSDPWKGALRPDAEAIQGHLAKVKKSTERSIRRMQEVMRNAGMKQSEVHPICPRRPDGKPYWPDKPPEHPLRPYLMADVGQWP